MKRVIKEAAGGKKKAHATFDESHQSRVESATAEREQEKQEKHADDDRSGEILVSASADGRISHWSLRRGFECSGIVNLYSRRFRDSLKRTSYLLHTFSHQFSLHYFCYFD